THKDKTLEKSCLFQACADLFFILNKNGSIFDYKACSCSCKQIDHQKIIGKRFSTLLPGEAVQVYEQALLQIFQEKKSKVFYFDIICSGEKRKFEAKLSFHDNDQCVMFVHDITLQMQAAEEIIAQKDFLKSILESFPHPFYVINVHDYTIMLLNEAAKSLNPQRHTKCYEISHNRELPSGSDHICPMKEVLKTKSSVIVEHVHFDADRNPRYIEVHAHPIFDENGKVAQMIEYCMDITERKNAELRLRESEQALIKQRDHLESLVEMRTSELRFFNAHLQEDINKRRILESSLRLTSQNLAESARDLENALEKEKELGELRSRFVSMASHEFRTPLTSMMIHLDFLKNHASEISEEQKIKKLEDLRENVCSMTKMLEDVMVLGKADVRKTEFHPALVDISKQCEEWIEDFKNVSQEKYQFQFSCTGEKSGLLIDKRLIGHVITNLIGNAIKFSPAGGIINISLIYEVNNTLLKVEDHGIGIPEEEKATIFESFHRAPNVSHIEGSGLGLSIVKRYLDLHSATITVDSRLGQGTTFTISFPRNGTKRKYNEKDTDH
ncbi:MAG: PAS domain-containing sensor histidine kinase, partial [Chlamydiota bacterium]|nr:PAS domain-containing sensor histidine kinase [Chlamydiota bacterium]